MVVYVQDMIKERNLAYWKSAAKQMDRQSRFFFPAAYGITLGILGTMDMSDNLDPGHPDYDLTKDSSKVQLVKTYINYTPGNLMLALIAPLVTVSLIMLYALAVACAKRNNLIDESDVVSKTDIEARTTQGRRGPSASFLHQGSSDDAPAAPAKVTTIHQEERSELESPR